MTDPALTITFADLSGAAENRWIRLEQVGRDDDPGITFAEAAALIDDLYDTSPCDNGGETGTGGEASGEPVGEETFLNRAVDRLRVKPCEEPDGFVDFEVDVCRSHQDEAWNLVGERVEIGESVIMTGRKTEVLELEGAVSHDLAYPYYADLRVSGATVRDVRGSTVNFAAPVTGRVRVAYTAVWERVTVRVPSTADKDGIQRAEDAAVICFWSRLAATLDLRQPEDDTDRDTLRRICPRYRIKNEGDCYETVRHYQRCNCSGAEATGEWSEDVAVPCPDGAAPGDVVGERREFDGYVSCEGEADEFSSPAHYREHCCGEPKGELPRCEVEREENRGDAEIEGGAEMYRELYGDDVRLIAVTPEGGCGEIIRTWHIRESAAGTDPPRLYVDGTGGTRVGLTPGGLHSVRIDGGTPPFRWVSIPRGMEKVEDIHFFARNIHYARLRSDKATFWGGVLRVADACGREGSITLTRSRNCRIEAQLLRWEDYDHENPPGQPYYPISMSTYVNRYAGMMYRNTWGEWRRLDESYSSIHLFGYQNDNSVTRLWRSADGNYLACIERIGHYYDQEPRSAESLSTHVFGVPQYCHRGKMVANRRTIINGETMYKLLNSAGKSFMKLRTHFADNPIPGDVRTVTPLSYTIGGDALMTLVQRSYYFYRRYGQVRADTEVEFINYCDQEVTSLYRLEQICED